MEVALRNTAMLFSSQLPLASLIEFCRVLRHNLGAGLSLVHVFRQQATKGPPPIRPVAERILHELEQGESLETALEQERAFFPPMFISLAIVGERTGSLPEVFTELEKFFLLQQRLRRQFFTHNRVSAGQIALSLARYIKTSLPGSA